MRDRMHAAIQPLLSTMVQLIDIAGHASDVELLEERLLERSERPLNLPFAFRVAGLTRRDLDPVMCCELQRRRMQQEAPTLRSPERAHPVGAHRRRHPTRPFEEPDETLEGVLPIDAVREPPCAVS